MFEDVIDELPPEMQEGFSQLLKFDVLLQWLMLVLTILVGIWLGRRLLARMTTLGPVITELAQRLTRPLIIAIIAAVLQGVLQAMERPATILAMAATLALTLALIRVLLYGLKRALRPGPLVSAFEHLISATLWTVAALHLLDLLPWVLNAMDEFALTIGEVRVSLLGVIKVTLALALFLLVATLISSWLERRVMAQQALTITARVGINKVLRFTVGLIAILVALNSVGIDLTALTVFSGALGVGIGFGLQRTASNFISGFILVMDRSIRQGDVITVGESFGWVKELRARYIVVANRDGVETLIPNENLITSEVINWSYSDRLVRLKVPVQISYDDDPERAIELLVEVAKSNPRVESDPSPVGRLIAFGDSGVDLEMRVWIDDPEGGVNNVRSELLLGVWKAFKAEGITIPFPQRDVHVRSDAGLKSRIEALEDALKQAGTVAKEEKSGDQGDTATPSETDDRK